MNNFDEKTLTLDETIDYMRSMENSETKQHTKENYRHIAEWLMELKIMREKAGFPVVNVF